MLTANQQPHRKGEKMENIYRRFRLINKEKEKALLQLVEEKRLTLDDLCLIVSTIQKNESTY